MRKVKFKKVSDSELIILQSEVADYGLSFIEHFRKPEEHAVFTYSVGQVDTSRKLLLFFRNKIESGNKLVSFQISATEAVVLLHACSNASICSLDDRVKNVAEKYKNHIDQQLKSIIAL